ncbi:MAG: ABC transporter substrate-binding protein [Anaerolineae bacterium]|nr:ABC transporter substrate-binding protein [Anaerolineae bacterium]
MFSPNRLYLFSVIVAVALLLAACGGAAQPVAPAETEPAQAEPAQEQPAPVAEAGETGGGVIRIGISGSPDTLNPGTAVLAESYDLFELIYDSMYDLQLDGSFAPSLAESAEVSDDGKVWTFKIRSGVKFHDGEPLTASDVAFTYNLNKSREDFPYMNPYTVYFESVEAPDDQTVVITLTEPIPNMESQLFYQFILPEHIWSQYNEGDAVAEFENTEMIGSGPFKMVEYKQNEFTRLAANKDHFRTPPKVDEIIFQTFGNPDALVQAIITGQVDMVTEIPLTAVPTLKNAENVELAVGVPLAPSIRDIIFNQTASENCPEEDGVCSGHPALRDRNVRLALAHATDLQNIIDVAELGFGTPGVGLIADSMGDWYNKELKPYEFNIDEANKILDDAGYKDTDGDGVREMPDGANPLVFRLSWPNDIVAAPRTAELMGNTWGQIGVKTEPQALDPDAVTSICCPTFDFDIIIWGWGSDPDPGFLLNVMTTKEIPTGNSETGYSNPEYDQLYEQQAVELDHAKRREMVWEMQRMTHEDVVYLTYYQQQVQAFRPDRFKGWLTDAATMELQDPTSLTVVEPVK